jgi:hypothetical protein
MVWVGTGSDFYAFSGSQRAVYLEKWTANHGLTVFWLDDTVQLPSANVVLYLALTRDKGNVIITTRVLDKNNQLLFERGFVDTPQLDAALSTAQFRALTGITTISLGPDSGPPILSGKEKGVAVLQFTDGNQPPVDAIFDNFSLCLHDVPPISIARAARLTWPVPSGVNYSVEGATNVQGPWLPIQDLATPGMQQMTVPATDLRRYFRLMQAP